MVRTRFAPSPTGTPKNIHLGFVIRALWNYAYAKKNGGKFVLRIEDTDQKRSRKDTENEIYDVLRKFGIHWDEGPDVGGKFGPYRQSERLDKYKAAAKILVERGYAYYDFDAVQREKEVIKAAYKDEEKLKELKIRPKARQMKLEVAKKRIENNEQYVVRAKIPEDRTFEYKDWILKKNIRFFGKEISDLILLKSDGFPTYHLAVVVDDIDMQISHVFRGQEWISSTPIHLYLYEGFGHKVPEIGHFTVILDPRTKKKFSKRDMTALFGVNTWLKDGYLTDALLNYLMLLGWAPKDNREIFSLDQFIQAFDQAGIQKANPTFDVNKLDWFNGHYIRQKTDEELLKLLMPYLPEKADLEVVKKIIPLIKDRIKKLSEFKSFAGFFFAKPQVDKKLFGKDYKIHLQKALSCILALKQFSNETMNGELLNTIKVNGFQTGEFFMSLRISITGSKFTPPINESMVILGKKEVTERLNKALGALH